MDSCNILQGYCGVSFQCVIKKAQRMEYLSGLHECRRGKDEMESNPDHRLRATIIEGSVFVGLVFLEPLLQNSGKSDAEARFFHRT